MISLLKNIDQFDVVLASQSPRRFELLSRIGLEFTVKPSHVKEEYSTRLSPGDYVLKNAMAKGWEIAQQKPEALVISADTIVVYGDKVLEKPTDEFHAMEILKILNGRTHEVLTGFGITFLAREKRVFNVESTKVTFRKLSEHELSAYIDSGEPFDKAGGYGAQGLGSLLIEKIEGCYFNVVGFPLARFFTMLDTFLREL